MADWAGAVAAMRARFVGAFNAAPVKYQNEDPPQSPWPPAGPWIYFEVIQTQSSRTTRLGFRQGQATKLPICLSSVPLLTDDSQIGANLQVCPDEENRADWDQRG